MADSLSPGGRFPPGFIHRVIIITGLKGLYHARIQGGGAKGALAPPPQNIAPQIVRRGPRGPCPPPGGPRGPWPPPYKILDPPMYTVVCSRPEDGLRCGLGVNPPLKLKTEKQTQTPCRLRNTNNYHPYPHPWGCYLLTNPTPQLPLFNPYKSVSDFSLYRSLLSRGRACFLGYTFSFMCSPSLTTYQLS